VDLRISSGGTPTGSVSQWQDRKQAGKDLATALRKGDLDAATAAYATMTKDGTGMLASHPDTLVAKLGQELQSGDLAAAQQTFAGMALHHHHRTSSGDGAGGGTAPPSPPTATTGNGLNVVA
jgi:hypothetical protein